MINKKIRTTIRSIQLGGLSKLLAAATLLAAQSGCRSAESSDEGGLPERITIASGVIEGRREANGVNSYKGIPYAAAPVGRLRWAPPQPVAPWTGIRQAKKFGRSAEQTFFVAKLIGVPNGFSEDALYLNVWTPASSASERLPVMVWIHGGGYQWGSSAVANTNGTNLAKKGVIVVSMNYRLGAFGFLSHPELGAENGGASGNYGILDQIAALRWVQANIASFGGDPSRVTIFGESAGAFSVSYLAASPKAKGLFQALIAQSGGSFAPASGKRAIGTTTLTKAAAEAEGKAFLAKLGVNSIAEARALPASTILDKAGEADLTKPVLDGDVIVGDLYELYRSGKFHDTPILIGSNTDDGGMFVRSDKKATAFVSEIREQFAPEADRLLALYPHRTTAEATRSTKDMVRDLFFSWHNKTWATLHADKGRSKAYVYRFDYRKSESDGGPAHAAEIPYVFGTLDASWFAPKPTDRTMSELMSQYWVNFATTGNPNGPGLPAWQPFTADQPGVLHLRQVPEMGPMPETRAIEIFDSYFERLRMSEKPAH